MNVAEYAELTQVSPRRVRAMARSGVIQAHRTGDRWEIDEVAPHRRRRRPLSPASRLALTRALHTRTLEGLSGQMRARTAERVDLLRRTDEPAHILADWWGGVAPTHLDGGSNLVVHAIRGNHDRVAEVLHRPRTEYLREPADLARTVRDERAIHGLTRRALSERADVDTGLIGSIERAEPLNDIRGVRRVLRALEVEPLALPPMDLR
ncbi:helix-turn-helix domain-containing protein [Nocardia vermiculata]|uniref:Helix-turn-helix domain-containing protein n=1 Tax=Nocardia vermiculata TaxID=257274 RepID=A0A846XV84_9NOCA|nr:helix-turn-helix domain-containing protein [Nocardia vermiculata]NKY50537.1 helix-turn-helix domain-containing protein [Nocardia vermiculata]